MRKIIEKIEKKIVKIVNKDKVLYSIMTDLKNKSVAKNDAKIKTENSKKNSHKKSPYDFYAVLTDVIPFRTLIEATKEFLTDVNLECHMDEEKEIEYARDFNDNYKPHKITKESSDESSEKVNEKKKKKKKDVFTGGIKIVECNSSKSMIISIRLNSQKFIMFHVCKEEYDIAINLIHLAKLIKNVEKDDILTMFVHTDEPNILQIHIDNDVKHHNVRNKLKTLDVNKVVYHIPPLKFTKKIKLASSDFHKICKDLGQLSDNIQITCGETSVTFSSIGDSSEKSITLNSSEHHTIEITKMQRDNDEIVEGIYEIKHFLNFNKCHTLCHDIEILMKNKRPIFLKYQVASLGHILIGVQPIADRKLADNNNFSDSEDEREVKKKDSEKDSEKNSDSESD